jgi:hypothetical protein
MIEALDHSILWSNKMEFVSLGLLALGFIGLGSAATVLLAKWLPQPVAEAAAHNGRFAGLGGSSFQPVAATPYRARRVQQEAMNVVGSSN